ncbi:zinc ribbon domain-containing protein [Gordonia sp. VNK21]|uniref:zinc ribbon domain-containing protein n=1 Tax=Gordonia sp. VNK21 TaxID=3382483 RepID=UPI0038D45CDF
MKAAPAEQRQLLDLADLDADIARARHQLSRLPEDEQLAELETQAQQAAEDRAAAQVAVDNLDREYQRLDKELTGMAEHARRDQAQLDSGGLGHKALAELQHEMTGLTRRRDDTEAELLEIMEQQEATGAELDRAQAVIAGIDDRRTELEQARRTAAATLEDKVTDLLSRRDAVTGEVPGELLSVYEKLREQGRVGAGLLRARRCGACRMELDPRTLAAITAAADDEVVRCEECGAILVRTEQSGLSRPAVDE